MAYIVHVSNYIPLSVVSLWFASGVSAVTFTSHGKVLCPGLTLPLHTAYHAVPVPSFRTCYVQCAHDESCRAISYRKIDGVCYYFDKLADDDCYGLVPDSSVKFFTKIHPYKCLNNGTKATNGRACTCVNSYVDTWCQRLMRDCDDGGRSGYYVAKTLYTIKPQSYPTTLSIYCHTNQNMALIAHNGIDTPDGYFNRRWDEMKYRIGDSHSAYWAGLETLHVLTSRKKYRMIVMVKTYHNVTTDKGSMFFMNFLTDVKVASESESYRLSFSEITEHPALNTLRGSAASMNNSRFSTYDRDNDDDPTRHCAMIHGAPFWFQSCGDSNPLGTVRKMSNYLGKPRRMFFNGIDAIDALPIDFQMYLIE